MAGHKPIPVDEVMRRMHGFREHRPMGGLRGEARRENLEYYRTRERLKTGLATEYALNDVGVQTVEHPQVAVNVQNWMNGYADAVNEFSHQAEMHRLVKGIVGGSKKAELEYAKRVAEFEAKMSEKFLARAVVLIDSVKPDKGREFITRYRAHYKDVCDHLDDPTIAVTTVG